MSAKDEVRKASTRFYAALNRMLKGDVAPLAECWSQSSAATTMHPIGGRETGWKKVDASWQQFAGLAGGGAVKLKGRQLQVAGSLAYESGIEHGHVVLGGERAEIEHRVTNVYRREGKRWKIVYHHADASPAMIELLARLQAKA